MKQFYKLSLILQIFCATLFLKAQFVTRATAPLFLTFDELKVWTPTGSTASSANVSTVPLAARFNDLSSQINPNQSYNLKIDWTVDGVDRWSNYLNEVPKFNTYNFVNWSYIDKFTWFSNAANGVFIPPKAFIDAAHKNGVKIVGTVMIGSSSYYTPLLTNTNGDFPAARKLIEIAKYYGFDGYLFNMEASTTSTNAASLQKLLKQMQSLKTPSMDISWYDSLLTNGTLNWYDQMNTSNVGFMESGGTVSNSFFSNYNWTPTDITTSVNTANTYGISPFNVYMGNDAWTRNAPNGYLYNKNFMDNFFNSGNLTSPKCSAVLYAFGNLIYEPMASYNGNIDYLNNPADFSKYYEGEAKFFSGDDVNFNTTDAVWKGVGHYIPARSVINTLPFETNFNIGQGKIWATNGTTNVRDWSDAAKQDILPTWQWSKTGTAAITPRFDADLSYNGGTSLKFAGTINNNSATVKLYQTKLSISANTKFDVTFKMNAAGASSAKLLLYFSGNLANPTELDLGSVSDTNWKTVTFDLSAHLGKELNIIGIGIGSSSTISSYQMNIGNFKIYNQTVTTLPSLATIISPTNTQTGVTTNATLNWNAGANAATHDVYFGTDAANLNFVGNQTATAYNPGTLQHNTTYYWRIDEKNAIGTTTGEVWSFTTAPLTLPPPATYSSPANSSSGIATNTTLSWNSALGAESYDVYIGTDANNLVLVSNQAALSYALNNLQNNTKYFWRIDSKNAAGTTMGQVWSFTTAPIPVITDNALTMNSSGAVTTTNVTELNSTRKFTFEAWVKFNSIGAWNNIFSKAGTTLNNRIGIQTSSDNRLYLFVGTTANSYGFTPTNTITTGVWYHIAMVYDGALTGNSAKLKLYINGVQKTLSFSGTIPTATPNNTFNFLAGSFNGTIDEVRVWNTAITRTNIQTWMNKKLGNCHPNNANLKLYWNLDDNSSPQIAKACLSTIYQGNISAGTYGVSTQATAPSGCTVVRTAKNDGTYNIDTLTKNESMSIYPNPVSGSDFTVEIWSNKRETAVLELYNMSGILITRKTVQLSEGINKFNNPLGVSLGREKSYLIRTIVNKKALQKIILTK